MIHTDGRPTIANAPRMIVSPSGASATCSVCGTIHDLHWVDASDYVPEVGDGCDFCSPSIEDEDVT